MKNPVTNTEYFDIQRKIVANMTSQSWHDVPHVSYLYEADASDLLTVLRLGNAERPKDRRVSVNTLALKLIAEGLKAAPAMNAHIRFNRDLVRGEIDTLQRVDISMPMKLPNGKMMTVTVPDCGNRSLDGLADYVKNVRRRALNTDLNEAMYEVSLRDSLKEVRRGHLLTAIKRLIGSKFGKHRVKNLHGEDRKRYYAIPKTERLTADDLEQGSVTVSNLGSVCRDPHGTPGLIEIVPPQVCAIAVGALCEKPVVRTDAGGKKRIDVGTVLPLSICFDHRALDFGDIVPFISRLDELFASPETLLEWMGETKDATEVA